MKEILMTPEEKLWKLCKEFIEEQNITWAEQVYQSDRVIENSYAFIASICNIVGYQPYHDDEDE